MNSFNRKMLAGEHPHPLEATLLKVTSSGESAS